MVEKTQLLQFLRAALLFSPVPSDPCVEFLRYRPGLLGTGTEGSLWRYVSIKIIGFSPR